MKLFSLILSDIRRAYGNARIISVAKAVVNPSILACILVRLCSRSGYTYHIWRLVSVVTFGVDVAKGAVIGSGLKLPHPSGIVIGRGVVIDSNVTLYQGVTLGAHRGRYPKIESGVTIYPGAVVVGEIVISSYAVIGALAFVDYCVGFKGVVRR